MPAVGRPATGGGHRGAARRPAPMRRPHGENGERRATSSKARRGRGEAQSGAITYGLTSTPSLRSAAMVMPRGASSDTVIEETKGWVSVSAHIFVAGDRGSPLRDGE